MATAISKGDVLRYASKIVDTETEIVSRKSGKREKACFGKKVEGHKKESEEDSGKKVTIARHLEGAFGLEIAFVGEDRKHCAIWCDNELVFNNVGDLYRSKDYDRRSTLLMRLVGDSEDGVSNEGDVFLPGEWKSLLKDMAEKIEDIIKAHKNALDKAEKEQERRKELNDKMSKFLPFKYRGGNRLYRKGKIEVFGGVQSNNLCVYYDGKEVFNFLAGISKWDPAWEGPINEKIKKEQDSIKEKAERYGYDYRTLEKKTDTSTSVKESKATNHKSDLDDFLKRYK